MCIPKLRIIMIMTRFLGSRDSVVFSELFFFFSSRRRHTRLQGDWSSDVCSSDLVRVTTAWPLDLWRRYDGICGWFGTAFDLSPAEVIRRIRVSGRTFRRGKVRLT